MTPQEQYPDLLTIDDVIQAMAIVKSKTIYGWQYTTLENELKALIEHRKSVAPAPAQGVEEADEYFYCKEWNNIGYMCEEQCDRCKKTENFTLDDPKMIKEAQSQALKYSEQYSEDRRISKKSSFIVGFIAGSRWQQGQGEDAISILKELIATTEEVGSDVASLIYRAKRILK
ncbi:MAG: hypothetical protein ACK40M_04260 [Flavobacteriales bacterium]